MDWRRARTPIAAFTMAIVVTVYTQMLRTKFKVERELKNQEQQFAIHFSFI